MLYTNNSGDVVWAHFFFLYIVYKRYVCPDYCESVGFGQKSFSGWLGAVHDSWFKNQSQAVSVDFQCSFID